MIEATAQVSEENPDPLGRNLTISASAQVSFHIYMASLGTLRSYAEALGQNNAAALLQEVLDGIKQQDQQYTALAEELLGK